MDSWVASTFWILWIMPLWTRIDTYLFKPLLSSLLGTDPGMEFAASCGNSTLHVWRCSHALSAPQLCGVLQSARCFYVQDSFWALGQPCEWVAIIALILWENGGSEIWSHLVKRLLSGRWRFESLLTLNSLQFLPCHAAYKLVIGGGGNRGHWWIKNASPFCECTVLWLGDHGSRCALVNPLRFLPLADFRGVNTPAWYHSRPPLV